MKLRIKMALSFVSLSLILFSLGSAVLIRQNALGEMSREKNQMVEENRMIVRMLRFLKTDADWYGDENLMQVAEEIGDQIRTDTMVLYKGEEKLYQRGRLGLKDFGIREEAERLSQMTAEGDATESGILIRQGKEGETPFLRTCMTIQLQDADYHLILVKNITAAEENRRQQLLVFRRLFLLLLLASTILSWVVSYLLTRPLRKLQRAAHQIAGGNLSSRSRIRSRDEIGALSRDFDRMAENVEWNVKALEEAAEQKDRFMGAFSHEMKTPMTSIIGYADLMRSQKLSEKDQQEALDYIWSEARRLENLAFKMLELFQTDGAEFAFTPADPGRILAYTAAHFEKTWEKSGIHVKVHAEKGKALLEPDLFRALVLNLLDNARKAMPEGGTITLRLTLEEDGCVLWVKDPGKGIPPESLEHLTEAFYRVDKARARSGGSVGLGLSLCDRIVKLHRGSMTFESEQGKGTLVTVRLKGGRP